MEQLPFLLQKLAEILYTKAMRNTFSWLWQVLKRYLSASAINATICGLYRKAFDMVQKMAKRDDTKAYASLTLRICKRILLVFGSAWGIFVTVLTFRYFGQGLSLLIEGWSGTMTVEFEAAWILMATKIAIFTFAALFVAAIIGTVYDLIGVRRRLKASADVKDLKGFVTEAIFDEFRGEIRGELTDINEKLDKLAERKRIPKKRRYTKGSRVIK